MNLIARCTWAAKLIQPFAPLFDQETPCLRSARAARSNL
jgi:hypothetical protein